MADNYVIYQPNDVIHRPINDAQHEVSFDNEASWRPLTADERRLGLQVAVEQPFVARVTRANQWGVTQHLKVRIVDGEPRMDFDGPRDPCVEAMTTAAHNVGPVGTAQMYDHSFSAWLTLFRDAEPDRQAHGNAFPIPFEYHLLKWSAPPVLSTGGTGYDRLAATVAPNIKSFGPNVGELLFVKTPDSCQAPRLAAVFVPAGLDVHQESVPVHVFFSPSTGGKKKPYPYSEGDNSFNAMIHTYLTSGAKRFLSQHVAARKRCVFVFPVPPSQGYLDGLKSGDKLRQYCLEIVFYLQKFYRPVHVPTPRLDRCALSGFSEGGRPQHEVLLSLIQSNRFPELKEMYLLDVVSPSGSSQDTASYTQLLTHLEQWWAGGTERRVRIYTEYGSFAGCPQNGIKGQPVRSNGGAWESQSNNATFVFTPPTFWSRVGQEGAGTVPDPGYSTGDVHQLMPCVFMQHALANSGFASL